MSEYELLAKASGCRLYKRADLIIAKEQPAQWIPTVQFVLLLISGIPLIFGVVSLVMYLRGSDIELMMCVAFIIVGSLFGLAYVFLNKYSSKIKSLPPAEFNTICSFDLKNKILLDSTGKELDSFENTLVHRELQLTSSSKKLVVRYSDGVILLAKGNPFSGGTEPLEKVFRGVGLIG